jgi:nicotinate dehydrogenase subunit B
VLFRVSADATGLTRRLKQPVAAAYRPSPLPPGRRDHSNANAPKARAAAKRSTASNDSSTSSVIQILSFKVTPKVTPSVVQRADEKPQRFGEPVTPAAPAAVANAFFDATGVWMRTAPLTPPRVRAALKAAGVT